MPSKKKVGIRLHALTLRFTPAAWAFAVWMPMVPALAFLKLTDPITWFTTVGFALPGLIFIYDGLTIFPDKGKIIGMSAAVIMFALGASNIFLSAMVWFHYFNPFTGSSVWTPFAIITLGLGVLVLLMGGVLETYVGKLLGKQISEQVSR